MIQNFVLTLAVLCSVAALALHQEPQHTLSEEDVTTCRSFKTYKKAIPRAGVDVDSIKALVQTTDLETCLRACCALGPSICQYAWLFEGKCLAVSCLANPEKCYPKYISTHNSIYIKMGYYGEGEGEEEVEPTTTHSKMKPTTERPEVEPTTERPEVEPTTERPEVEPTTERPEVEPTTERPEVEPTTERPEVEPTTERPEVETTTPTNSRGHHYRPSAVKPVPTSAAPTTPHIMDDTIAELEEALNSSWTQGTLLAATSHLPPSAHTSGGLVSVLNITAGSTIELQDTNIGLTFVVVLLSCFFGFLFLFFLLLGCACYITRRGKEHKSKKVSYTVVDREDQVDKLTAGKGFHQPPSSIVLSDSESDEGGALFSMVGMTANNHVRGNQHKSLASGLLPM